ncbi:imidazole glycerol phosphate synthase subunit HisH [Pseudomonas oryzihabitans]|uniref:imidazole glycerol phosphate synthase subunit HisH n=1 Tax=Pseudomonas oryzihabitans TaxID=47885 RepID=UPI00135D5DAA|nr:imidazole glycerol phosphate synthase subunit HisH [Pseudomonas oryzihabitans]
MTRVCVLDYGAGNVRSVLNLFESLGPTQLSNDPEIIAAASHLVLPGVGAFGAAMAKVEQHLPLPLLRRLVLEERRPFLGICVGMQLLADEGLEFGHCRGLGWIPGRVERLASGDSPLPHVGWNDVRVERAHPLLQGLEEPADFYFVHSYGFQATDPANVLATVEYGERFAAVVGRGNVLGVQFHPEKSQGPGRRLLRNFLELA